MKENFFHINTGMRIWVFNKIIAEVSYKPEVPHNEETTTLGWVVIVDPEKRTRK